MSNESPLPIDMIVFDFDGTICDSAGIKDDAFRLLYLDEMGVEFADQVQAYHVANAGVSRFDKIVHIEEQMIGRPCSNDRLAAVAGRFAEMVEDRVVAAPLIDGAAEFLTRHSGGPVLAVASATPTDELRRIVRRRGMGTEFAAVEGSPDSKGSIVRRYLERFGADPERTVMVGDQMSDYIAAVGAGVAFVGVGDEAPDLDVTLAVIADLTELDHAIGEAFGSKHVEQ